MREIGGDENQKQTIFLKEKGTALDSSATRSTNQI
jgi:hypothetical protein